MRLTALTTVDGRPMTIDLDSVQAVIDSEQGMTYITLILSSGEKLEVRESYSHLVEKWKSIKVLD